MVFYNACVAVSLCVLFKKKKSERKKGIKKEREKEKNVGKHVIFHA